MPDDLDAWWRVRAAVPWASASAHVAAPVGGRRDGFVEHVVSTSDRDAARADRLGEALSQVDGVGDLTFELMTSWQARVLGVPAPGFRTGTAYAKGGRERYGLQADTRERFQSCLADVTDPSIPLPSRAARVYLDVAFVHPFPDGNGRAAMLCLAFVLRRDRVVLDLVAPVLRVVRRAGDLAGTLDLIRLIEILIAAAARRAGAAATADGGTADGRRCGPSSRWSARPVGTPSASRNVSPIR